ncbi:molybdopterin-containing oxidoreductase family protein [Tumebacillus permanentifrigoris]|uniref:Anaerobic selenocysteine-containing dehydrogenase n=1 Tax=Tumebacillus permanentifrigoris TaxID=378543 RepID=A0A316E1A1_9BACL|nr:molybdopterin-dependent oxidoreductase [Tumebacillus permanentifrigoris]PWK16590.1 anaerobic selenocysteine-containing dehydrogenase [Tumebacillus permanentifrigoris]
MAVELIKTACPLDCWDCCGMIAHVEDGRLIKVEGDPDHPITQGTLCGKGRKLVDRYHHEERVLEPLKKVDGEWQPISWEQAFQEIAAQMQAARAQYGATAVMHHYDYGSSGLLKVLEQRFFNLFGGFTDTVGSICWGAGLEAQKYDFGYAKSHHPDDLAAHTDLFVIWGRNVSVTNMHMMPYLKAAMKRGAELVIIDPLKTDLSDKAVKQLQPRPGSDGALALGIARHLLDRGLVDEAFVQEHAVGYEQFAAYVQEWTVERAAEVTGVEAEDIRWLAEQYGSGRAAATILGLGMQRYANGGNTIRLIDAVVAMSGNVGRPGGGVQYGNQVHKFDYATLMADDKPKQYRAFTKVTEADEMLAVQDTEEPVKVLFVTRSNPVGQLPDTNKTLQAYATVDTVVVLDMFMHDTGVIADYFLPCTTVFEEEDIMYSSMWHSYMTYVNRVVEPRGNTKPDWAILQGLARELGFGHEFGEGDSVHQWMEVALKPLEEQMGISREKLQREGIVQAHEESVAWSNYQFGTPSGKYEFYSTVAEQDGASALPVYEEPVESPYRDKERAERYPYHLLTIHPRRSLNSQYYHVLQMPDRPVVEISPLIARETGLRDGDLTRVYNDRGEILGTIKVTDGQHKRTIKIEEGWWGIKGTMLNTLTSNRRSDLGIGSTQYDCLVNLAKV